MRGRRGHLWGQPTQEKAGEEAHGYKACSRKWIVVSGRRGEKSLTANKEEGVRGTSLLKENKRCHDGVMAQSAVGDNLPSKSHQLANNQSIPLMIFNHTVNSTLSTQLKSDRGQKQLWTELLKQMKPMLKWPLCNS